MLVIPDDDAWIAEAREFLRTQRGDRAAVGATRLGFSPTLMSMGLDAFSVALYEDPGLVQEVLDRYVGFAARTVEVFTDLGFDAVWCFDDFAYHSGPMFSPKVFREVFAPAARRATERIGVPWVFHSDGNLFPVLEDLLTLGMSGLHPIEPEAMDLAEAKRRLAGRACVLGNISVDLLGRGRPEQVREAVRRAIAVAAPGGGYVITSGNSIPAYARQENVEAFIEAVWEFRGAY
jgi:uroporphyrinogen decarboxylase